MSNDPLLRTARQTLQLSIKAGQGLANAAVAGIEQAQERRGARAASRGLIGPDDPPPPPEWSAAVLDYRGLARPRELGSFPWKYRLGRPRRTGGDWGILPGEVGLTDGGIARHAAVIGPPGSGKTASIAVPWIYAALNAGRSVVAMDVRGDLWPSLRRYGAVHGKLGAKVFHWDPGDPGSSSSWRWLEELDSDEANEVAVGAIMGRVPANQLASADRRHDAQILSALFSLTRGAARTTARDLMETLADPARVRALLARSPSSPAAESLRGLLLGLSPGRYPGAVSGALAALEPLATPRVSGLTTVRGLSLDALTRGPALLIVGVPSSGARSERTVSGLMLALAAQRWLRGFPGVPALLVLDEAPLIQSHVDLTSVLSLGARVGLAVLLCAQDVCQFDEHEREELLANCGTIVMLPGVTANSTEYLARRLGMRQAVELARSVQRTSLWRAPRRELSTSSHMVEMIGHREISSPPFDRWPAIAHAATLHPRPLLLDLTRADL
ncbi:MAG: type IV secretory system conjugative DNA transfer family protein [Solirubrobacteraceae bacterium]